jgi:hypothetical protein
VRSAIAETELETFYGPVKIDGMGRNIAKPQTCCGVFGQLATCAAVVPPAASALA